MVKNELGTKPPPSTQKVKQKKKLVSYSARYLGENLTISRLNHSASIFSTATCLKKTK
jgi:hypothetical protein